MLAMLRLLGLYDTSCAYEAYTNEESKATPCVPFPDPASSIEFRLYKDEELEDYFIQIYYNGMLKNLKKLPNDQRVTFLGATSKISWQRKSPKTGNTHVG